jgi:hypothetical protein
LATAESPPPHAGERLLHVDRPRRNAPDLVKPKATTRTAMLPSLDDTVHRRTLGGTVVSFD